MSITTILIVVAAVVVVMSALAVARSRRSKDGVDSFRRQIDALSPEARRPVVGQVQHAAGRQPPAEDHVATEPGSNPAGEPVPDDTDVNDADEDDADEDDARGT